MSETPAGASASAPDQASTPDELWLSPAEQRAWRQYLYGSLRLEERISETLETAPGIELTRGEYEILVRLSEADEGRVRMSDLADLVVHSRSRLTHTITRMERRGIVERVQCSHDRRGRHAQLTDAGRALLEEAAPIHVRSVRDGLLDVIGHDDLLELGRILARTLPDDAEDLLGPSAHG